jgi:hypothetical protein
MSVTIYGGLLFIDGVISVGVEADDAEDGGSV